MSLSSYVINCQHDLLRKFTRLPHLAGTEQNLKYAEQIKKEWQEFGLDSVELVPYDVLLSYPNKTQPNYISIVDSVGNEVMHMDTDTHRQTHMCMLLEQPVYYTATCWGIWNDYVHSENYL